MTANQKTVVDWLKSRVAAGCGYIMGATGQLCTRAFREQQARQYSTYDGDPNYGQNMIMGIGAKWDGKNVYDCQAIVRKGYEQIGIMIKSGATTQYKNAKESYDVVGPVSEMPAGGIAGAQLWRQSKTNAAVMSHTATCIGDGKLIEAASTRNGVVISSNIAGYAFYGVPKGLLEANTGDVDKPVETPIPAVPDGVIPSNDKTVAVVTASSVNLRETPGGEYVFKIPHGADIEIDVQQVIDGKLFGHTEYAAPYGKYKGDMYDGWIEMQYVTVLQEGGTTPEGDHVGDGTDAWGYLRSLTGLSAEAVAGIMGNIQAESGWYSNNLQNTANKKLNMSDEQYTVAVDNGTYTNFTDDGYGYGLCQWTHWSRKANLLKRAREVGSSIGDMSMQLEFMWSELQSYPKVLAVLRTDGVTIREASDAFMTGYEKPANVSEENKARREALGWQFYNQFIGGVG